MRFALCTVVAGLARTAAADTVFDEVGPEGSRPATRISEVSCDLDLAFTGAIATGELRQRLRVTGDDEVGASYSFELPRGVAVTSFSTKAIGGVALAGIPVTAPIISEKATARDVIDADPALLEQRPDGTYRMTVQPLNSDRELAITTRFVAPAEIAEGALRLVVPPRSAQDKQLAPCRVVVKSATAGPGATIVKLPAPLTFDTTEAVIDVDLAFAKPEPLVWTQTEALGDGKSATLVTVIAPPRATVMAARRALFVIDTSRSMEMVGRANALQVMRAIATSLPAGSQIEAIAFDRTAHRVFAGWKPASAATIDAIAAAITARSTTINGTDLDAAFTTAHAALGELGAEQAVVIAITDGMLGDLDRRLTAALDAKPSQLDVHVVALDPPGATVPSASRLREPIELYGGSYVEVGVDELAIALPGAAGWLRPSWTDVTATGGVVVPAQLRAGAGATQVIVHAGAAPAIAVTAKAQTTVKSVARVAPGAGAAVIALATPPEGVIDPRSYKARPIVTPKTPFAVLTDRGRVAANRTAMVRGGGPYTRMIVVADADPSRTIAPTSRSVAPGGAAARPSAIAKIALERMLREQLQPKAYACYQRALGLDQKLAGLVTFDVHIARGEVTRAGTTGIGDATFRACLADAAYLMTPPLPDPAVHDDDETVVHYPVTFKLHENKPLVVPGDADSDTAIDIDAVQGGVPAGRRTPVKVDGSTPLGGMRPSTP